MRQLLGQPQLKRASSLLFNSLRTNSTTPTTTTTATAPISKPAAPADDYLKKIDLNTEMKNFSPVQQMYFRKLIERNAIRARREQRARNHFRISGLILFTIVFSVYGYTMLAIKQEKFLDDFDTPEPPDPAVKDFKEKALTRAH